MIGLIISFAAGIIFGVVVMCCCFVARHEDRITEKYLNEDKTDIS